MITPIISVIMPVFNGEKFLKSSIKSILDQTYKNFELIIINDGSKDSSLDIIKNFKDKRVKVINNVHNLGITKSLNKGIRISKGEFIARCDADDINFPNRFNTQLKFLRYNRQFAIVGSNATLIDEDGKSITNTEISDTSKILKRSMFIKNNVIHSSVMFRKEVLEDVGLYDEFFVAAEDYELWLRILSKRKIHNLKNVLIQRRIHNQAVTKKYHFKYEFYAILARLRHIKLLFN